MGFFRQLWQRASDVQSLSSVFGKPIEWSYLFRLHVLLVAIVVAGLTGNVSGFFRQAGYYVQKLPAGIVADKKGEALVITGLKQPFEFHDGDFALRVDTTTSTVAALADGVTVSGADLVVSTAANQQRVPWNVQDDFHFTSEQVVAWWNAHQDQFVVGATLILFVAILLGKLLMSIFVVAVWSAVVYAVHRALKLAAPGFHDLCAINAVALTGPLLLWTLLSLGGYGGADLIETIAFLVYSSVALQVAKSAGAAGTGASGGTGSVDKPAAK